MRVEWEIYHKVFKQLNGEAKCGYPFSSDEELVKSRVLQHEALQSALRIVEQTAAKMPKAYGDAFRYIAYRDLNERMFMYLELAAKRMQPESCDPRCVATRATA
jgi:hypothetical protein